MGFKFNPFTGTLDIAGDGGGGGVESFNDRAGEVTLVADDIPVDDSTLEVSNDETVIQIKDKGVTESKLSDELNSEIDSKAEASDLVATAKDANQKFFGGGEVSAILNSGPMSDGYTIADGASGVSGNENGTETRQRSQPYIANFSGTVENIDLFCYIVASSNISEGYVYLELYNADNNGFPTGSALASSSHIDYTLLPVDNPGAVQFTLGTPVEITKDNVYAIVPVLALTASDAVYSRLQISRDLNNGYSEFLSGYTSNNGSSWSSGWDYAFNFQFHIVLDSPIPSLSFTENINVARPGLALEDNVIEAPVSPIALDDGDLLYVIPNEDDQGSALVPAKADSSALPNNALVLAYRDGEDIVVDGVRLEVGQKAKLSQSPNIFDEFRYLDISAPENTETLIQTFSTAVYSSAWLEYQLRTASGNFKGGSIKIVTDAADGNVATLVKHVETSIESDTPTGCDILVTLDTGEVNVSVDNTDVSDEAKISWFIRLTPHPTFSA